MNLASKISSFPSFPTPGKSTSPLVTTWHNSYRGNCNTPLNDQREWAARARASSGTGGDHLPFLPAPTRSYPLLQILLTDQHTSRFPCSRYVERSAASPQFPYITIRSAGVMAAGRLVTRYQGVIFSHTCIVKSNICCLEFLPRKNVVLPVSSGPFSAEAASLPLHPLSV